MDRVAANTGNPQRIALARGQELARRQRDLVGRGDYEYPGAARGRPRYLFLQAVARCEPRVLSDLAEEPLHRYERYAEEHDTNAIGTVRRDPADWWPELAPVRDSLVTWARIYRLDTPWCLHSALMTLNGWHRDPSKQGSWVLLPTAILSSFTGDKVRFSFIKENTYNPLTDRRSEREQAILAEIAQGLAAHFDRLEEMAKGQGLVETPEKRNPEHYDWLALFVVKRWSYLAISRHVGKTRPSVTEAIQGLGRLIDLPATSLTPAGYRGSR